jgi:hypothetical protein
MDTGGHMALHPRRNSYHFAIAAVSRLFRKLRRLQGQGKVEAHACQCVQEAISCLRRSSDFFDVKNLNSDIDSPKVTLKKKKPYPKRAAS